jgi:hypothetical protein
MFVKNESLQTRRRRRTHTARSRILIVNQLFGGLEFLGSEIRLTQPLISASQQKVAFARSVIQLDRRFQLMARVLKLVQGEINLT